MAADKPPLASVDGVREELRRLGYLDRGLDRFVLSGAAPGSPLAASSAVALRVGLAGGALFGSVLTLAAAGLDRRLVAEPRDLLVLALYLVLSVGVVSAAAALVGGLAAAWAAQRSSRRPGPTLTRNVGVALAATGLGYLFLWWRSHATDASLIVQGAVLAVGLLLSLVLGRFGSLAAVAVLSAGGLGDRLPQASLSRRQMVPLLVIGAGLLAAGATAASYVARQREARAPEFAVVPSGLRLRLLGVDGLERRMAEQLMAHGEMPRLAELRSRGAYARLVAERERVPAIVWTTIATGRGPEAHGIRATGSRRLRGMSTPVDDAGNPFARALGAATDLLLLSRPQPPTSVLRGVKTFWGIASEKGLRVGIVNWWATWPADSLNGYLVSDRAFFKIERREAPDREVFPPQAFARVAALPSDADDRPRRLDRFALDANHVLAADNPPDISAIYLPGLDITTMQQLGEAASADLATLDNRLAAVRAYYRFIDERIGQAAAELAAEDVLIVVGDPGRLPRQSEGPAEGLLAIAGAAIAPGALGSVSERDVAPTVLHLAGLPQSRELSGRVLDAALAPAFRAAHPVRFVASYGSRPRLRPAESAFDREMLDELRSLGYVQ